MKGKMTPHIIAVLTFAVFIVFGLACASTPKPPKEPTEIVYNPTGVPTEQLATIFIGPGHFNVHHFDGVLLNSAWYQVSSTSGGMDVKIPAGSHTIGFDFYRGGGFGISRNLTIQFDAVAGRNYTLFYSTIDENTSHTSETVLFEIFESSQKREPMSDEQLVFIKLDSLESMNLIFDKNTDNQRIFRLKGNNPLIPSISELRVIVSKGEEHTIDVELPQDYISRRSSDLEPEGVPQRTFTASSEPIRYSLKIKLSGTKYNAKAIYALTRE